VTTVMFGLGAPVRRGTTVKAAMLAPHEPPDHDAP
jgi:hypothetical protein